jgi:hypothetical protein
MLAPPVLPRVVETGQLPGYRVKSGEVGALVAVAMGASESQVRGLVTPLVLFGDDVIDLVAESQGRLRDSAVFTPISCPPPDSPCEIFRHEDWFDLLSDSRAFDRRTASS